MPRSSYKSKNRLCKNTNLTENQFLLVLWSYAQLMIPTVAESRIKEIIPDYLIEDPELKPVTRVTLSRYHLMLGDHYFRQSHHIEHPHWPLRTYALWRALFRIRETGFGVDELVNNYYHSAEFDAIYSTLQVYFKPRQGTKLNRFTSHIGSFEKFKSMHYEHKNQKDSDEDFAYFRYRKLREELEETPLDPKCVISYRLSYLEHQEAPVDPNIVSYTFDSEDSILKVLVLKGNKKADINLIWPYSLKNLVRWALKNGFAERDILKELGADYSREKILQALESACLK